MRRTIPLAHHRRPESAVALRRDATSQPHFVGQSSGPLPAASGPPRGRLTCPGRQL